MSEPTPARILVVEDEAVVAMDIRAHLEGLGYRVVGSADSGEQALSLARERKPDLVLMDVRLKGRADGVESGRRIREELDLPVVFLTAYADRRTLERAKGISPQGYIVKPFDERDLSVTVELALERHRLERAVEKSRRDLLAVLDAQRQGAVLLDGEGRVGFVSRPAGEMLALDPRRVIGREWESALGLPRAVCAELRGALAEGRARRRKVRAELERPEGPPVSLEIEALDDPGDPARRILFLYDVSELRDLRRQLEEGSRFEKLVGESEGMRRVFQLIRDLAPLDAAVLIRGESGTGKELVARAIHNRSARAQGPFVAVNCGGLGDELAAGQLFGHRRGAFTGAVDDRPGYFEAADRGTLFLDEIGELSPRIQSTMLRVLEEGEVHRVGETRPRPVDVRVIAATHRDLEREIEAGGFRTDLYYRVRAAQIELPPLRERRGDLPLLARTFLARATARSGKPCEGFDDEALRALLGHGWPGNVRELKHAVEFALVRSRGSRIGSADLPPEIGAGGTPPATDEPGMIRAALAQTGGNRKEAAKLLGLSRATLYRRLKRHGIE